MPSHSSLDGEQILRKDEWFNPSDVLKSKQEFSSPAHFVINRLAKLLKSYPDIGCNGSGM